MSNLNEAKKKYLEAKKAAEECQAITLELQSKSDRLSESIPGLKCVIEKAEKAKREALDRFAIYNDKTTEAALKAQRQTLEAAQRDLAEANELAEAVGRALKSKESELPRLCAGMDLARRECWQAIADGIRASIPPETIEAVRRLEIIGTQCGQTRQGLLNELFLQPSTDEFQQIRKKLCGQYGLLE